ncbi:hypothetical protein [Thalassorhabdomicrobium marinisediminis]|uniref:Uncharacterized protein n=1 Tax=Thalassorhabdomicrobium marinisediminis TaxID=2170577 RepID=A0A2T7FYW3_9RHOB|nr:hypothetical protein [Thalassorhabdomicrobium marinisediminis]PVA07328.1 hypothetical protein DC363_05645 [Thalassorhabdomicrobium marinisediminis]
MIRPAVKSALWRWREVLAALALSGLGLWWGFASFGIVQWLGWGLAGLGGVLAFAAAQKVRFRPPSDGPGVVTLDERRITYLGPLDGGVAELDQLVQLDLTPAPAWRLIHRDGSQLDIPVNARGVEALFEVFTALPGMKTEHLLSMLDRTPPAPMTVWMAPDHRPYRRLH